MITTRVLDATRCVAVTARCAVYLPPNLKLLCTAPPEKFCRDLAHTPSTPIYYSISTTYKMPPQRRALQEISGNNSRGPNLSSEQRAQIIALSNVGCKTIELASQFNVTQRSIQRTLRRWASHATTKDLPRSGRPEKTTPRDVRRLVIQARKTPKITYKNLLKEVALDPPICKDTVYRKLKGEDIRKFRCKRKPKIVQGTASLRLKFERRHRGRDRRWRGVRFSDECLV